MMFLHAYIEFFLFFFVKKIDFFLLLLCKLISHFTYIFFGVKYRVVFRQIEKYLVIGVALQPETN